MGPATEYREPHKMQREKGSFHITSFYVKWRTGDGKEKSFPLVRTTAFSYLGKMINLFSRKKKVKEPADQLFVIYTLTHVYLQALVNLVVDEHAKLTEHKKYNEIFIEESKISNEVKKRLPDYADENILSQIFNLLAVDDYINPTIKNLTSPKYVQATPKGWTAANGGEFAIKAEKRQFELLSNELTKTSIQAHEHQRFINWMLIAATILAALMPFVVALFFNTKVYNTNVLPPPIYRPDIRIDSVWLLQKVDSAIQKKLSTLQLKEARE